MRDDLSDLTPAQRSEIERLNREAPWLVAAALKTIRNLNRRRPPPLPAPERRNPYVPDPPPHWQDTDDD